MKASTELRMRLEQARMKLTAEHGRGMFLTRSEVAYIDQTIAMAQAEIAAQDRAHVAALERTLAANGAREGGPG